MYITRLMLLPRDRHPNNVPQAASVAYMTVAMLTTAINTSLCGMPIPS